MKQTKCRHQRLCHCSQYWQFYNVVSMAFCHTISRVQLSHLSTE